MRMVGRPRPSFGSIAWLSTLLKMSDQVSSAVMRMPWRSASRGKQIAIALSRTVQGRRQIDQRVLHERIGDADDLRLSERSCMVRPR